MTRPTATKNAMLDGVTYSDASLHSAFPGSTGANELTGGTPAYARKAITVNAASAGQRLLNAAVTFDVPAGTTVRWVGFWNSTTFRDCAPNGGYTPKNFMSIASSDLVYSEGHGYSDGTTIVFYNGTTPAPLVEGTVYYVRDATTDSFKVAATAGGAAINLTGATSFGCVVCRIAEEVFALQGTHELTTSTFVVPD